MADTGACIGALRPRLKGTGIRIASLWRRMPIENVF
jgi:hypothetical protein